MSKPFIPSYSEYLQTVSAMAETDLSDFSYYLRKHPSLLQYFNRSPNIVYVFNYPTRHYSYISENIATILGHRVEAVYEGGASLLAHLYHKQDFKIFSEQIFRLNIKTLSTIEPAEREKYRIS